jgi:hypothetical protein
MKKIKGNSRKYYPSQVKEAANEKSALKGKFINCERDIKV